MKYVIWIIGIGCILTITWTAIDSMPDIVKMGYSFLPLLTGLTVVVADLLIMAWMGKYLNAHDKDKTE